MIAEISGQSTGGPPFSGWYRRSLRNARVSFSAPAEHLKISSMKRDLALSGPPVEYLGVLAPGQRCDVDRPEHALRVGELAQQDLPVPGPVDAAGQLAGQLGLGSPGRPQQQRVLPGQQGDDQRPDHAGALIEQVGQLRRDRGQPLCDGAAARGGGGRGGGCHLLLASIKVACHLIR